MTNPHGAIDTNFKRSYLNHLERLKSKFDRDDAFRKAIGGDFEAVGKLEYHLLRSIGMTDRSSIADVGCGSGRLAVQMAGHPNIKYQGFDVVPDLLVYARELCNRPDWLFELTDGRVIPVDDSAVDIVCMFSVITHLLHEDSFRYFQEASRVLARGGKLVVSFLEFLVPSHWAVFRSSLESNEVGMHLNQFVSRDALSVWAQRAGLEIESIRRGDECHIPIPEEIVFDNGSRQSALGTFGQSVAVFVRP